MSLNNIGPMFHIRALDSLWPPTPLGPHIKSANPFLLSLLPLFMWENGLMK